MVLANVYLDAAATTPPHPEVIETITRYQYEAWANPSSIHYEGFKAAETLERSRISIADSIKADPDDLLFTSGATESVHLALLGAAKELKPGRLVISAVEHPAVLAAANQLISQGWILEEWPVDQYGVIRLDLAAKMLSPPTRLISLIWGQSEVGSLQPIQTIGKACRERGVLLHTDATQLIPQGRISWNECNADLLSFSAHKLQGPRGVGVLMHRSNIIKSGLQSGGNQERGLRAGTEAVALIAGLAKAIRMIPIFDQNCATKPPGSSHIVNVQRDKLLVKLIEIPGIRQIGPEPENRLPNHISILVGTSAGRPLSGREIVRNLSNLGIACSSGSACRSGLLQDSPVLEAMGVDQSWRQSGVRMTLGPWLKDTDLDNVPLKLKEAIATCS